MDTPRLSTSKDDGARQFSPSQMILLESDCGPAQTHPGQSAEILQVRIVEFDNSFDQS
jgi:hypothetical protein